MLIVPMTMFIVLASHSVHVMNMARHQVDQVNRLEPQARLYGQPVSCINHYHLILLLSPKADTHFSVPRRGEG